MEGLAALLLLHFDHTPQEDEMGELAMIIRTKTQPGKRDDVQRRYRELLVPRALANEAQEAIVWCDDQHDPDTFLLFEIHREARCVRDRSRSSLLSYPS